MNKCETDTDSILFEKKKIGNSGTVICVTTFFFVDQ